jgi:hypothetical protein
MLHFSVALLGVDSGFSKFKVIKTYEQLTMTQI